MVEMGRFMVYNCGSYYSQVQDIKKLNDSYVAILDGGIHHLNYYGQMMGMKVPLLESPQNEEWQTIVWRVLFVQRQMFWFVK